MNESETYENAIAELVRAEEEVRTREECGEDAGDGQKQ